MQTYTFKTDNGETIEQVMAKDSNAAVAMATDSRVNYMTSVYGYCLIYSSEYEVLEGDECGICEDCQNADDPDYLED